MKIITFYLPQFHTIPENDEWWGKGFTEWTNVRKGVPLYENHYQPRVPANKNYYNLLDKNTLRWQIDLAKENGIYGFCIYHYWFSGKLLLEKPLELLLSDKSLDIPFCMCWANENWTNGWAAKNPKILISQEEGTEELWEEHFNYMLKFFTDKRYIKEDNKPLLVIYKPNMFKNIDKMLAFWENLAKKNGFSGMKYASQLEPTKEVRNNFDYVIDYQPTNTYIEMTKTNNFIIKKFKNIIKILSKKILRLDLEGLKKNKLKRFLYDDIWNKIINKKPIDSKSIPGGFVDWDNTARKGSRGYVIDGATPEKFYSYMLQQIDNAKKNYKKDYIFLFAWNEWAECGYLEPDEKFKDGYLKALKRALEDSDNNENN